MKRKNQGKTICRVCFSGNKYLMCGSFSRTWLRRVATISVCEPLSRPISVLDIWNLKKSKLDMKRDRPSADRHKRERMPIRCRVRHHRNQSGVHRDTQVSPG